MAGWNPQRTSQQLAESIKSYWNEAQQMLKEIWYRNGIRFLGVVVWFSPNNTVMLYQQIPDHVDVPSTFTPHSFSYVEFSSFRSENSTKLCLCTSTGVKPREMSADPSLPAVCFNPLVAGVAVRAVFLCHKIVIMDLRVSLIFSQCVLTESGRLDFKPRR